MRAKTLLRAASATLGGLALCALLAPSGARAYTFLGGSLDLTLRDARVFNNFTDPEANNNTTPDPSFPGATGAPLAIWKAIVEWGSELHGDGHGDPEQPGGLGSGGANFDAVWQGLAPSVGRTNDNVFSEISGSSGGLLAFCELPIADGWRIRFYQNAAVWHDGPLAISAGGGNRDIQGAACHEYGHALGLDHSSDLSATMSSIPQGAMTQNRTIEADDIAGVQALYGPKSPAKPHVETYHLDAGSVQITGERFALNGNEVWFTDAGPGADGTPLKVTDVASAAGGTQIVVPLPAQAGTGDMLVRVPGSDGAALSNAFPFDPAANPCPAPKLYGTPKMTSLGTLPSLHFFGRPHLITNDLRIATLGGIPDGSCTFFSGPGPASIPFQGGTLLVSGPWQRHGIQQFDFLGGVQMHIPIDVSMVGTRRCYQLWFPDAGDPFGVGLSDAIAITFCP